MTSTDSMRDKSVKKIEHIGIAVKSLESSNHLFSKILGINPYKTEEVLSERVRTSFFQLGDIKIELLEATHPDSPIAQFIAEKGEGIHHIAFEVDDINSSTALYAKRNFKTIYTRAKMGADNKKINFLHPRATNRVLIELCQNIGK